jgi:uncharacterized membrane protein YdjX (TVP38/TMEM64 family)
LLRKKVEVFIARSNRFAFIDKVINSQNSLKLMFLLRLTPMPFALVSYALALTKVELWPYLWATSGILLYNCSLVYLGYATKHLGGVLTGNGSSSLSHTLLVFGLLALVVVLGYVTKVASKTLRQLNSEKTDL